MKTFSKVLWVVAFLASEALLSGCKFGWFCGQERYRTYNVPVIVPPKTQLQIQELPMSPPRGPVTKPGLITPWNDNGPVLEPTPIPPAEAPKPIEPPKPSSLKRERQVERVKDEVIA